MTDKDRQYILDEEAVFSYRTSKNGEAFISWRGKQVLILTGKQAASFMSRIDGLTGSEAQLVMAKVTGNFKRGNERLGKRTRQ